MKSNNIIMGVLVAVIAVMGVAFAAFSTTLTITGTATVESNWAITFAAKTETGLSNGCKATTTKDTGAVSYATLSVDGTEATVTAKMMSPGDVVTCYVTVTNAGSLDAIRKSFTLTEAPAIKVEAEDGSQIDAYTVSVAPSGKGTTLAADGGQEELTITIGYNALAAEKPTTAASFKAVAVYEQDL